MAIPSNQVIQRYSRIVPQYDRLHGRWLRYAGGEAQSALEAAARAILRPGMLVLDAGCGTGHFARRLTSSYPASFAMNLLDPSLEMLDCCADIDARRIRGCLEALPFDDASFDLVTCAWALETTADPLKAIREMQRVTCEGGAVCIAFCAETSASGFAGGLLKQAIKIRRTGAFLSLDWVMSALARDETFEVVRLPCRGPAAALLARSLVSVSAPDSAPYCAETARECTSMRG